jgi:hypothetical protein
MTTTQRILSPLKDLIQDVATVFSALEVSSKYPVGNEGKKFNDSSHTHRAPLRDIHLDFAVHQARRRPKYRTRSVATRAYLPEVALANPFLSSSITLVAVPEGLISKAFLSRMIEPQLLRNSVVTCERRREGFRFCATLSR